MSSRTERSYGDPYYPSNGTSGEGFQEEHCYQCIHERWIHFQEEDKEEDKCKILNFALSEATYDNPPKEWIYGDGGIPTCTEWVKFDWGDEDNFDEDGNPILPQPDNPYQMVLPFELEEWGISLRVGLLEPDLISTCIPNTKTVGG